MTREEYLCRISEEPEPEDGPMEFGFDLGDGTWHVIWDRLEDGRLESRCARAFEPGQVHTRSSLIKCGECAEQIELAERIRQREQTHFIEVDRRWPVIIRDGEQSWISPELVDSVSRRALGILTHYSVEQRVHVFAVPGQDWEFVPEEKAPNLAAELRLEERQFHELQ